MARRSKDENREQVPANAANTHRSAGATLVKNRQWRKSELDGRHEHTLANNPSVMIWKRDGKYLARGRFCGVQFAVTIGSREDEARSKLRYILTEIESGTFVPPGRARRSVIARRRIADHTLRTLADEFLREKQRLRGPDTARNYRCRLAHLLEFAEQKGQARTYKLARDLDRSFVVDFKAYLHLADVSRNGRGAEKTAKMAPRMIQLCLEALRTLLNWGRHPAVAKLPADFVNPVNNELLGQKIRKDPLRAHPLPIQDRIRIIDVMDEWQLIQLSGLLYLPTRLEDISGAMISDFDLEKGVWHLGHRLGGNDFGKGKTNTQMPLPPTAIQILRLAIAGRGDGPTFRNRAAWAGRRPKLQVNSSGEIEEHLQRSLARAPVEQVEALHGRKRLLRRLLLSAGAVSCDQIARELRSLFDRVGIPRSVRPYDVRHAATTDLLYAGVSEPMQKYLTQHAATDILSAHYRSLDLRREADKYFKFISPLLEAIEQRGRELHLWGGEESDLANSK